MLYLVLCFLSSPSLFFILYDVYESTFLRRVVTPLETFFRERLPVIIDCLVLEIERTGIRVAPKIDFEFEGPAIPNFENMSFS